MASKDDRMKGKRKNLKKYDRRGAHEQSSSSSQSKHDTRGIIDIADSSDLDVIVPKAGRQKPMDYPPDIDDDNEGNRQLQAADFKQLSELPISIGGHFQFSSEKNWDTDNDDLFDNTEVSEYFTLSLKVLNSGLKTIPFYKRMDYASGFFTNNQIINMEKSAEDAEKAYQDVLKQYLSQPKIKKGSSAKSTATKKDPLAEAIDEGPTDELDDLLNMTAAQVSQVQLDAPSVAATTVDTAINSNIEDDQKWLDDVLAE
ncbi:uncharacterized protein LOC119669072 [Teleopsis dalmanni]|uniref:uncharacterized protein LOC119669072 n=1 Tax=Teleopsis dalmanni TaxID=139649 RepID=UPI0018CF129C|nr:uncharacterized protein LOC119669072 [Teleopsis dalmanni]